MLQAPSSCAMGRMAEEICPNQPLIYTAENQHLDINLELVQKARGRGEEAEGEGRKQ